MKYLLLLIVFTYSLTHTHAQTIMTVAGVGGFTGVDTGDGGLATNCSFDAVEDVVLDAHGNIYVCTTKAIRIINSIGIINRFAGNGLIGTGGDGGPATAASLNHPHFLAVDNAGNLYIGELHRLRKVFASGIITTIAGDGTIGAGGDGGPATAAQIGVSGIAVSATGDIYVSDENAHVVRKIDASGIITRFAGTGLASFSGDNGPATAADLHSPTGLATDALGNVFIGDFGNSRVRKVDGAGIITTYAGNGTGGYMGDEAPATAAQIYGTNGLKIDHQNNLYICDGSAAVIRKVTADGIIHTVAGTGVDGYNGDGIAATAAQLNTPSGIAVDDTGTFYIADHSNFRVRKVTAHPVGVTDARALSVGVTIFPNPARSELVVSSTKSISDLAICDVTGRVIQSHTYNEKTVKADLRELPPGIYYLRINGIVACKFVRE